MTDNPKRRWYQYRLRSLFAVMTLFAIACGWYACNMRKTAKIRAVVAEIENMGGKAVYSHCGTDFPYDNDDVFGRQ